MSIVLSATALVLFRLRRNTQARHHRPASAAPGASVAAEAPGAASKPAPQRPRRRHDNSGFSHFATGRRGHARMPRIAELKKRPDAAS
ncbi:hypothetical protein [Paractinoplanes durhamensis]|uniref:hypothetical protein n=1 Tax=Paractinoplanes durhamensis TaxID=113563 RepID=UPI0019457A19|nr:hypothetical protein [Actinoplanes durhamensis]